MYLEACLQQRRHFSPFFASVDGLLGVDATATLKSISSRLASKWKQPYSNTCGYVRVGLPSLWCGPPTAVSEDHGYLHTKSVCRDRNGKTGQDWHYSSKNNTPSPTNHPTPPKDRVQTAGGER